MKMRPVKRRRLIRAILPALCLLSAAACARTDPSPVAGGVAQRGKLAIERHSCAVCHSIPGIDTPGANVGPPLTGIAQRAYIAGVLPNQPADMVRWLRDPPAVDPLTAMPDLGLTEAEAKDIAAYLYTLD